MTMTKDEIIEKSNKIKKANEEWEVVINKAREIIKLYSTDGRSRFSNIELEGDNIRIYSNWYLCGREDNDMYVVPLDIFVQDNEIVAKYITEQWVKQVEQEKNEAVERQRKEDERKFEDLKKKLGK